MKPLQVLIVVLAAISAVPLRSQDADPKPLLSKEASEVFQTHATDLYSAADKLKADLQLSLQDERVLAHVPGRGFPYLAYLISYSSVFYQASSASDWSDLELKSCSAEEGVANELYVKAMEVRLAANLLACFHLLKGLAPTPEAAKVEAKAKKLFAKLYPPEYQAPTETQFRRNLESSRALFDELRDLPKLTAEQMSEEWAVDATLAFREYADSYDSMGPGPDWLNRELKWHREWDHEGYLLAFSRPSDPNDFEARRMVVNQRGGIFECASFRARSRDRPGEYASTLRADDFRTVKDFLANLPPSDSATEKPPFVVSFLKDGQWTTRTYGSLPAGNPLESILWRMLRQSAKAFSATSDPTGSEELKISHGFEFLDQ